MMDELRDYRFYAEDLLHPSQVAIDYIWERFVESSISDDVIISMNEVEAIQRDLSHRPFNTSSESSGSSEDEVAEILQELVATARTHGKNLELDEAFENCAKIMEILIKHGQSLSHKKLLAETFFRMALVYDSSDEKMSHFSESLAMFQHCKEHEERA